MDCERARTQLTAYLDGELDGDAGTVLRGHLRTCEACRRAASDEATLRDGLRSLEPVDPPPSLWVDVQARLAAAEVSEAQRPAWRRALARWSRAIAPRYAVIGAMAAAATITLVMWKSRPDDDVAPRTVVIDNPPIKVVPDTTEPKTKRVIPEADDVTADLALDGARSNGAYADAIDELLSEARTIRAQWSGHERDVFDDHVKTLRDDIDKAPEGTPRTKASRALVSYLQGAVTRDDVLLAGVQ